MILWHLLPSVSYHVMLHVGILSHPIPRKIHFKFVNHTTELEGFKEVVTQSWAEPINGSPPYILWEKLKTLRLFIKKLRKLITNVQRTILATREDLRQLQQVLANDFMNPDIIHNIKVKTVDIIR